MKSREKMEDAPSASKRKRKKKVGNTNKTDDGHDRSKREKKKRKKGTDKSNKSKSSSSPAAAGGGGGGGGGSMIRSFVRGLSFQIPPASLPHVATSEKSVRLLLERSTEALPMGSPIRKAVGEDFDGCLALLRSELHSRLDEQRKADERRQPSVVAGEGKETREKEQRPDDDGAGSARFVVFSPRQYERARRELSPSSSSAAAATGGGKHVEGGGTTAETTRKLLSCTDYATPDVIMGAPTARAGPRAALDAFRSAVLSGQVVDGASVARHVSNFLSSIDDGRIDGESLLQDGREPPGVGLIQTVREFLGCFAMMGCGGTGAGMGDWRGCLADDGGMTGMDIGRIYGICLYAASTTPLDYVRSSQSGGKGQSGGSSSDDDSDSEEEGGEDGVATTRREKSDSYQDVAAQALRDVECALSIFLLGTKQQNANFSGSGSSSSTSSRSASSLLASAYVVKGIIEYLRAKFEGGASHSQTTKAQRSSLYARASAALVNALVNSSVARRGDVPSVKLVSTGSERVEIVRRWADGIIAAEAKDDRKTSTPRDDHAYNAIAATDSEGGDDDVDDESDGEVEEGRELHREEEEPLFVLDTAPSEASRDAGQNGDGDDDPNISKDLEEGNDDESSEDEKGKQDGKDKISVNEDAQAEVGPAPTNLEAVVPDDAEICEKSTKPTESAARSEKGAAKKGGRPPRAPKGAAKKDTETEPGQERRKTRSRSRGDSISSSADKVPDTPTRRSSRLRSRGDSVSIVSGGTAPTGRTTRARSRGDSMSSLR